MGHMARLRIIRDRFIAEHASCELRRHFGVAPETPIRDIVDHCRVWESHADSDNRRGSRPGPERVFNVYMVDDAGGGRDDRTMAVATTSSTALEQLESLLRRLLPTSVVPPPPPKLVPSELEQLLQWLLGGGGDTATCPTSEDWNHCNRSFPEKFASCESVLRFSDTAGPQTLGLDYGVVFLVWQNRPWGDPMSYAGCVVSFLAAGSGEGGSLADPGMVFLADLARNVTIKVASLADAGMAFPDEIAGEATVGVTSLADAGMVTVGVTDLANATPVDVVGVPECVGVVS